MAKFFTDFSEYTPGQQPSDWTERWATASGAATVESTGVPGGGGAQALRVSLSSNVRYALSWDEVGTPSGDVEVLIKALHAHTDNVNDAQYRPTLHGSGSAGTESGYYTGLNSQFNLLYLAAFKGGAWSNLQAAVAGSGNTQNVWYWLRIQRTGTTVRSRFWLDGKEEPEKWHASGTDGDLTSGWVGVGSGHSSGVVWYAQIGVGTGGDSAPSEAPETPATEVPLRSGIISGSRIAVNVDRTTAVRSGIVAGSRIAITAQAKVPLALRTGVIAGSRIAITAQEAEAVTLRSGAVAGSRIAVQVDVPVRIRSGVIVGTRAGVGVIADGSVSLRSGVIVGSRIAIQQEVRVSIRAGVIVGTRQAVQLHRTVRIRAGVIVGARDGYVGPGTGIVVPGQRFTVNALREGDTFTVFLPWGGLEGITAQAHVMSRTASDDRSDQDIELAIVAHETANVARLAGGATPTPEADSTDYARKQARQGREIDRIERNR